MKNRSKKIGSLHVRTTEREERTAKIAAQAEEMNLSEYIRYLIREDAKRLDLWRTDRISL